MNATEIANKLNHFFVAEKGYSATPKNTKRADGKIEFIYRAKTSKISNQDYRNHIQTEVGLTPSPLIEEDKCYWGALDIDTYNMDGERKKEILLKAKELKLVGAFSKSQGIHLYCCSKDKVLARVMRNYLSYCRANLQLDPGTEIFPKQDKISIKEDDNGQKVYGYGNGITIPYRAYSIHSQKSQPWGIELIEPDNDKIRLLQPHFFFKKLEENELPGSFFKAYEDITIEDKSEQIETTPTNYTEGSIQDPEMQKLTGKEILQLIKDEKMSLKDDSFFDDMITLYIGKGVGNYQDDETIIGPLTKLDQEHTGADLPYYRAKLNRARLNQGIDDPRVARNKFIQNVVYIKSTNKYFDLTTNQEYSENAINFEYARLFVGKRGGPIYYLKSNPKRLSVEQWVYDPTQYKKGEPLIKINGLTYLNSYQPNKLVAVKGDTKLWHTMLNHVFSGPSKYKEHFLNFHAFNLQNPGIKQRHGLVIVSTEFQFGKGSLFRALQQCYGINNALAIDIKQALDKSKGYLCNSMLVLIDEMQSSGKWEESQNVLNDMKRIITEKEVSSRALFVDYKIVKTCTNYMFFSNKKDALKIPNNELRYWIYLTDRPRLPQQYYSDFHKWLDDGGAQHIYYELLNHELPESYDPQGTAPTTPFQQQMSEKGEHPLTQYIRRMYDEEEYPFRLENKIIGSTELYEYLRGRKTGFGFRINDVSNALEQIGGKYLGQCRVDERVHSVDDTGAILSKASDPTYEHNWQTKAKKPTLYLVRDVAQLGHNQPQQLADKYYKPLFKSPDLGSNY